MDFENLKLEPLGNGVSVFVSKNHTFGTDAVLLSNFAKLKNTKFAVDLGTGCGIIPLLLCRENPPKRAVGVDISEEACALAKMSVEHNNFSEKIEIIHSDLKDLKGKIEFGLCDVVTCNPPYKAEGAGIKSKTDSDIVARHETACSLNDIIAVAAKLLQTSGHLFLCQRPERLGDIICLMRQYKIEPKRLRTVSKTVGHEPWLILIEGRKGGNANMRIDPPLFVYEQNGDYTKEMLDIYSVYKESCNNDR